MNNVSIDFFRGNQDALTLNEHTDWMSLIHRSSPGKECAAVAQAVW